MEGTQQSGEHCPDGHPHEWGKTFRAFSPTAGKKNAVYVEETCLRCGQVYRGSTSVEVALGSSAEVRPGEGDRLVVRLPGGYSSSVELSEAFDRIDP